MTVFPKYMWTLLVLLPVLAQAQRLSEAIVPLNYQLTFTPDLQKAVFTGDEIIQVQVAKSGQTVVLNAAEIQIQQAEVTQGDKTQAAQASFQPEKEQVTLAVENALEPGPATIHIKFSGILNDKLRGFYLSRTKSRNYATTQFEAADARRAFPCFDEPAFKATFDITLIVDKDDTAISNGSIIADVSGPGAAKHTLKFATTPRMSSYLVAMAVGDFECSETSADNIPIRVCSTPDKRPLQAAALRYAAEILKFYDQYYGIPYPFKKLDILGLPDFEAGAMENTAAIFYRESLLFIDDNHSSLRLRKEVFEVLAHEMAHQWFGDLVTMKWWDNVWLNEGFATWMALKPSQALHPEWNASISAVADTNRALRLDSLANTHPIRASADTPQQIEEMFDPISYEKAAAVLRMVEFYVSPDVFRRGVNVYLRKFAYGNATAEDFWNALAGASGRPVDRIMKSFVDQPGVPLVQVKSACPTPKVETVVNRKGKRVPRKVQPHPKTEITLTQERFLDQSGAEGSALVAKTDPLWMVPVCIKAGDNKPFCQLLGERSQVVPVIECSPWVFTNAGAVGYYRTQYGSEDFSKLNDAVSAELTTAERVALVNDEAALAQQGREKIGVLLALIGKLSGDQQEAVVGSYLPALKRINDYLLTASDRDLFHDWVRAAFRPMMVRVGWVAAPGEIANTTSLRADVVELLGVAGEDSDVISQSTKLARQYLENPDSVDATLARRVLVVAARNGDAALFEQYTSALRAAKSPEQFSDLSTAITEFRDPQLMQRLLEMAISPEIRNQDAPALIGRVLANPAIQGLAWQWVKEHWADVEKNSASLNIAEVVAGVGNFCDASVRDDVQQFFGQHMDANDRILRQSVEKINVCISYREHQQTELSGWLQQHTGSSASASR